MGRGKRGGKEQLGGKAETSWSQGQLPEAVPARELLRMARLATAGSKTHTGRV